MQKITPHLWFDKEARQAAEFYSSLLQNSKIKSASKLADTPSGTVELVSFQLAGQDFAAISAGPYFKFTPAVSFLVECAAKDEVDALWRELSPGGSPLMPLSSYPFSERYGWIQDRYGLSWQAMFMGQRPFTQKIVPTLMFTGAQCGRAEEAINFFTSVFGGAAVDHIVRYEKNEAPDREGTVKHAAFTLDGQQFAAMDSARAHGFSFNEAISFIVRCETQEEIDYYWGKLSADPKAEQCGWLKDRFGVSWQVIPVQLLEMLKDPDPAKAGRVTQSMLQMKKIDIAELERAREG